MFTNILRVVACGLFFRTPLFLVSIAFPVCFLYVFQAQLKLRTLRTLRTQTGYVCRATVEIKSLRTYRAPTGAPEYGNRLAHLKPKASPRAYSFLPRSTPSNYFTKNTHSITTSLVKFRKCQAETWHQCTRTHIVDFLDIAGIWSTRVPPEKHLTVKELRPLDSRAKPRMICCRFPLSVSNRHCRFQVV